MVGGRPVARLRGGIDATIYAAINARDLTPSLPYGERTKSGARFEFQRLAQEISDRQVSSSMMRLVLVMTH